MPKAKASTTKKTGVKKTTKKATTRKKAKSIKVDIIKDEKNIFSPTEIKKEEDFFPDFPSFDEPIKQVSKKKPVKKAKEKTSTEAIDQQKKFFTEIADGSAKEKKERKTAQGKGKSLGLYRRLVIRFVALTVLLLVVVFFFSFSKLTVSIVPKGEIINDSILLRVYKEKPEEAKVDFREEISGEVREIITQVEKTYSSSGEEFVGEDIQGEVTIINNYSRNQPLVATTRLLSPDNKLYRIKEAVNVPAGGSVDVEIYADKPGADMASGLTTFTIPGLWLGLQDKIYAKNNNDFVFKQRIRKYVRATDISQANQDINNLLLEKAKTEKMTPDKNWLHEIAGSIKSDIDAKVGEEVDSFVAKAEGKVVAVSFSEEEATGLAKAKLALLIPDDKELIEFNANNISYSLDGYDSQSGIATVKVSFQGLVALKTDTGVIDKKQLVNLNEQQLSDYLSGFPEIREFEFKFYPSFIKRAPRLPERIKIEISSLSK